jgi:hypothetical protein
MKNIANCSVAEENKREEGHGEEAYTNINILPSIHRLKAQDQNNTVLLITGGHLRLPPLFFAFPSPPNPIYMGMSS